MKINSRLCRQQGKKRLATIYALMKQRCYNPKCTVYKDYGARGITVSEEWLESSKPFFLWASANGYQDNLEIDRINNDGNYSPDNCRWTTRSENCLNRRDTFIVNLDGEDIKVWEYAKKVGIHHQTLKMRIRRGWSVEKALTTPLQEHTIKPKQVALAI